MEVLYPRCAGLDVHARSITACARVAAGADVTYSQVTVSTTTQGLLQLADWLSQHQCTHVAMEATGVYWRPVWHTLEGRFELRLVNARHAHNVPGRKTDVADAAWLAQLGECGLLRGSFVPDAQFQRLRDLTRYRRRLVEAHTAESNRMGKTLEDAGVKLDSVASSVLTLSGQHMIAAMCQGERDPQVLADMALGRLRSKIPQLREALPGRFGDHHAAMCRLHLQRVSDLEDGIATLDSQIAEAIEPFASQRDRLCTIPGVATCIAEIIIAEIGVDMARFPTAGHLASWAGMCPGNNESAGKHASGRTRKGDRWLRAALTQAAWAAARTKRTYLAAQFWRIAHRRGRNKAAVAVGHSILVAAYHILRDDVDYHDLGEHWFTRRHDPEQRCRWLVNQLQALGHTVTLT